MWESEILTLGDGTVLVECGPMRMFIEASAAGIARPDLCARAAEKAIGFLEEVARYRGRLQAPALVLDDPGQGTLAYTMWESARLIGDSDLTPMAAVAGTIADATAEFLDALGMTRVVVNNGGDLAVRLRAGETLSIGIRPDLEEGAISHRVIVAAEMGIGGIATSGLSGRSFTRGVASSATVFARTAALADAAATAVANATYVPTAAVIRMKADSIYPDTDLRGVDVTVSVGELSVSEIETAVNQGLHRAEQLVARGLVLGATVAVKGRMGSTSTLAPLLIPLQSEQR